ncbi:MAG: hypothetical protein ACYTGC_15335 [Planctomycetota bacterium]|jgi:hypothetical protein
MHFGHRVKAHVVVLGLAVTMGAQGCAHDTYGSVTSVRQETWRADLDDCREVSLSIDRVREDTDGQPARKYEQLTLHVRPQPHLQFERTVKTVDLEPGMSHGRLSFDDVEVRTDPERRRVWFVERATGRVIATLDRETGATTGPDDDPPAWATPDGGLLLELHD